MKYRASLDRPAKIATIVVHLILGAVFILVIRNIPRNYPEMALMTLILLSVISIPVFTFLLSPAGYLIDKEEIKILRRIKPISIRYADIIDISIPDEKLMRSSVRSGGVGGIFGYFGNFYNKTFGGDMKWYVTQLKKFVLIKTKPEIKKSPLPNSRKIKVIVLTPDNFLEFAEELKMKIKSAKI